MSKYNNYLDNIPKPSVEIVTCAAARCGKLVATPATCRMPVCRRPRPRFSQVLQPPCAVGTKFQAQSTLPTVFFYQLDILHIHAARECISRNIKNA